ncbi:MAG: hypothetical protein J7K04_14080, partial [Spirochaetales bacterium]|nr:hypothetical protein [Spirochaetales bacterium]
MVKLKKVILHKDSKITILALLKNFYDEEIFSLLIKEFYNQDIDISLAAIKASGSIGNEAAVSHLYQIIEKGKIEQKIASIKTLASIRAPSSINMLIKYFDLFEDKQIRNEIINAINTISPVNEKVQELNKSILLNPNADENLKINAVIGLMDSGNLNFLKPILEKASQNLLKTTFQHLLTINNPDSEDFIKYFQDKIRVFTPYTLGTYLAAFQLKTKNPQQTFIIEKLQQSDSRVFISFLVTLSSLEIKFFHPVRLFRLLLIAPYIDRETEAITGDLLIKLIEQIGKSSPHLLNELTVMTHAHLETIHAKIKKNYISLKGIRERDVLLKVLFSNLLERYANSELIQEVQNYFKTDPFPDPAELIKKIRETLKDAPEEDKNKFEACISLFKMDSRKDVLTLLNTLSKINIHRPYLMRRLNRIIRVAGTVKIRTSIKKILDIFNFASEERIGFLQETSIVTLCQLLSRTIIEKARTYLSAPANNKYLLYGYIRGSRFIPPKYIIVPLIHLLNIPRIEHKTAELVLNSIKNMNIKDIKGSVLNLIKLLEAEHLTEEQKFRIAEIIGSQGDSTVFQPLLDLTLNNCKTIKISAIKAIRHLAVKHSGIPRDILTNRLYILLEDEVKEVQVEALLTLLSLKDDYALQILRDHVTEDPEEIVAYIIANLQPVISHDILSILLDLIFSESKKVQEALRDIIGNLSKGNFAEEIRSALLEQLKTSSVEKASASRPPAVRKSSIPAKESIIEHAKLEFKFKRENSQLLTVFFIDIVGYTEKSSSIDMSSIIGLIKNFEDITLPVIKNFKGTLIKKMGDGLLAVFKHPLNAVLASLSIQKKIAEYNEFKLDEERFHARIGLNTGLVIRKDNDIYGDVVNVASRMETSANPGDILLTQSTYEEIKNYIQCTKLGNIQVKGKKEPIPAYSAEKVIVDINSLLKRGAVSGQAEMKSSANDPITRLKESVFTPKYTIPPNLTEGRRVAENLEQVFYDLTGAIEEIARDYHEEYVFKKYLQSKWEEL